MMGNGKWRVSVFCGAIIAMGCSSSPPRSESRAIELAEAVCGVLSRCCTTAEMGYYLGPFVEPSECVERMVDAASFNVTATFGNVHFARVNLPNLVALDRAIRDGRVRLDHAAIDACVAWLGEQSCNDDLPEFYYDNACIYIAPTLSPCDVTLLVIGRVPEGGACSGSWASLECRDGLFCQSDPNGLGEEGACAAPQQIGEPCALGATCALGLYCSNLDGTCREPGEIGEACLYSEPDLPWPSEGLLLLRCAAGLTCSPFTSTCVAACDPGSYCDDDDDCGEDTGLMCVTSERGFPTIGFCDFPRSAGEHCSENDDCAALLYCAFEPTLGESFCQTQLGEDEPCHWDDDCTSGVCRSWTIGCAPTVANGQACASGRSEECTDGYCAVDAVTGDYMCFPYVPVGGACTSDQSCSSGGCVAFECASRRLDDGQRCYTDGDCASRLCNRGETEPRCRARPLADGSPCAESGACESQACFEGTCQPGARAGSPCGENLLECEPTGFFCDMDLDVPVCTAYREIGESCVRDIECRAECGIRWGRQVCVHGFRSGPAICDGQ